MFRAGFCCLLFSSLLFVVSLAQEDECKPVQTVENFDIEEYASKPWFSHQQAEVSYNPISRNFCVKAEYEVLSSPKGWGYTVSVSNSARDESGNEFGGGLCAYQTGDGGRDLSKLAVAPCWLPKVFAGPYWIVAYNEEEGYALISGGQPDKISDGGIEEGCTTGTGINNSGLWIFSRRQRREEALIQKVRGIAKDAGFDLSVLNDVDQEGCFGNTPSPTISARPSLRPTANAPSQAPSIGDICEDSEDEFQTWLSGKQDCDWVAQNFTGLRCFFYGNFCPKTCDRCEN